MYRGFAVAVGAFALTLNLKLFLIVLESSHVLECAGRAWGCSPTRRRRFDFSRQKVLCMSYLIRHSESKAVSRAGTLSRACHRSP